MRISTIDGSARGCMGSLATYLPAAFVEQCPPDWICHTEAHLLAQDLEQVSGYSSRVDLLLERTDVPHRLWIEFEVSRANPVANHARFVIAHLAWLVIG